MLYTLLCFLVCPKNGVLTFALLYHRKLSGFAVGKNTVLTKTEVFYLRQLFR